MGECVSRDECMCQERDKYPVTPRPITLLPRRKQLLSHSLTKWYDDGLGAPNSRIPQTQDFDLTSSPRPSDHLPKFPSPAVARVPPLNFARLPAPFPPMNKLKGYAISEHTQVITLGETPLADYWNAKLKEVEIAQELELMLSEPLDRNFLEEPNGQELRILANGWNNPNERFPKERLSEVELKSWQAACKVNEVYGFLKWSDETWPHLGTRGLDLYWTTRSDGCRYEYWSSDPGSNEYGVLVRVDGHTMTGIALGSGDGLAIVDEFVDKFHDDDVVQQLLREGWPHFG